MWRKIHRFVKDDMWRIGVTEEVASDREQIICTLAVEAAKIGIRSLNPSMVTSDLSRVITEFWYS